MGFDRVLSGEQLPTPPPVDDAEANKFNVDLVNFLRRLLALLRRATSESRERITFEIINATTGGPKTRFPVRRGWRIDTVSIIARATTTISVDVKLGLLSGIGVDPTSSICGGVFPTLAAGLYANVDVSSWDTVLPSESYVDFHILSGSGNVKVVIEGQ